jgi:hypothetical protein
MCIKSILGLMNHIIEALEAKIVVHFGSGNSNVAAVKQIRDRIARQFAKCQEEVYVGHSRLTAPLWELPRSRMRIVSAIFEDLPYAVRGIFPREVEQPLVAMLVNLRKYIAEIISPKCIPTDRTVQRGVR